MTSAVKSSSGLASGAGPPTDLGARDRAVTIYGFGWKAYILLSEALGDHPGARLLFCDGRLTFLVTSRRHDWFGERLGYLVGIVAHALKMTWEDAGQATFRREEMAVGIEGDKTYYFGGHADVMEGPVNIDLSKQPPPDLAIEVEVSHPADVAMTIYGRLGVPEVWRFDAEDWDFQIWLRQSDGSYQLSNVSKQVPPLTRDDLLDQLKLADQLGNARWFDQLMRWTHEVVVPRANPSSAE
jgi:Uma2 family endonuclease